MNNKHLQSKPGSSTEDSLRHLIEELGPWFHNMRLGDIETAPNHFLGDFPAAKWRRLSVMLPTDLSGLSVLDIGCNAGFYSIEMKRRGASRVLGIDTDPRYLAQARLAAEVANVAIELIEMSVYDIAALHERFDLVIFMGVLYHLRHPLLALDLMAQHVVREGLLFQSLLRGSTEITKVASDYLFAEEDVFDEDGYPKLHFIESRYAGDPTNWWIPNRACAEAMLRSAGFTPVQTVGDAYFCRVTSLLEKGCTSE